MAEKKKVIKEASGSVSYSMNTGILPVINASQYYTALEVPEEAETTEKTMQNWDAYIIGVAQKYIEEQIAKTDSSIRVSNFSYYHPKYYNNASDEINFTVDIDKNLLNRLIARHKDNQEFLSFIGGNYKSYDGFISYMASDQQEFIDQSKREPDRSLAQIIMYNCEKDLKDVQGRFESEVLENSYEADLDWGEDSFNDDGGFEENYRVIGYTLDENFNLEQIKPKSFADLDKAKAYGEKLAEGIKYKAKITYAECYDLKNGDKVVWQSNVNENEEVRDYWYFTTHGLQPGSVPKRVHIEKVKDELRSPSRGVVGTYFTTDKPLTSQELRDYEITEETPTEDDTEKCAWCGETFDKTELSNTSAGRVCHKCKKAIESKEGPIDENIATRDRVMHEAIDVDVDKYVENIRRILDDQVNCGDVYAYDDYICAEIDGDWKHDHLRANYLIKQAYPNADIEEGEPYEETGSDYYQCTHFITIASLAEAKNFKKMTVRKEAIGESAFGFNRTKKVVNEGPGAGYTVSGKTSANKINSFTITNLTLDDDGRDVNQYNAVNITADCDIDCTTEELYGESYYYDGLVDEAHSKITKMEFSVGYIDFRQLDDSFEQILSYYKDSPGLFSVKPEAVKTWLESHQQVLQDVVMDLLYEVETSTVIGGGWAHTTWDGTMSVIGDSVDVGSYGYSDLNSIELKCVDQDAIDYIDKATRGDNFYDEYEVMDSDDDVMEGFADEDEAIDYARKNDGYAVYKTTYRELYGEDIDYIDRELVWERTEDDDNGEDDEDFDESKKLAVPTKKLVEDAYQDIIANNCEGVNDKIKNLEVGQELVVKINDDFGYNHLHIKRQDDQYFKLWDTNDNGEIANETDFSSLENALYWANANFVAIEEGDQITGVEQIPTSPYKVSKKEKSEIMQELIDEIAWHCQCDNPHIYTADNGDVIMEMDIDDSDCEYYWDEYGITQMGRDGKTVNVVNVTDNYKKRKYDPADTFDESVKVEESTEEVAKTKREITESERTELKVAYSLKGAYGLLEAVEKLNKSLNDAYITETLQRPDGLVEEEFDRHLESQVKSLVEYLGL